MTQYLKFNTENGDVFYVKVNPVASLEQDEGRQGPEKSGYVADTFKKLVSDTTEEVKVSFEDALKTIKTQGEAIAKTIASFSKKTAPDEVQVTFGLAIEAEMGCVVTTVKAGGSYEVTLTWRKSESN